MCNFVFRFIFKVEKEMKNHHNSVELAKHLPVCVESSIACKKETLNNLNKDKMKTNNY